MERLGVRVRGEKLIERERWKWGQGIESWLGINQYYYAWDWARARPCYGSNFRTGLGLAEIYFGL